MNVPLLDLVAQYDGIKDQVLRAMMTVVERQGFIMGPEVALLETEIARLGGIELIAGMPVEVFMQTDSRTVISYLVRPLSEQIDRAFRER